MSDVLIFNLGGTEILGRVDLHHAIRMLHRKVAVVREAVPGQRFGPHPMPRAVELVRYVYARWLYAGEQRPTREAVLRRDRHRCAYCGKRGDTIDHILPRAQGGSNTWVNLVTACFTCNGRKDNRTPKQAGMPLLFEPREPSLVEILRQKR